MSVLSPSVANVASSLVVAEILMAELSSSVLVRFFEAFELSEQSLVPITLVSVAFFYLLFGVTVDDYLNLLGFIFSNLLFNFKLHLAVQFSLIMSHDS